MKELVTIIVSHKSVIVTSVIVVSSRAQKGFIEFHVSVYIFLFLENMSNVFEETHFQFLWPLYVA